MREALVVNAVAASLLWTAPALAEDKVPGRIIYWGNPQTGKVVRVLNLIGGEQIAEDEKTKIGGSGWVLLVDSTTPGYGAAICIEKNGTVYFHTAHGYATPKEASRAAREKAMAQGGITYLCPKPVWLVKEESKPPEGSSIVDEALAKVKDAVTHSKEDIEQYCTPPALRSSASAKLRPIGTGVVPVKRERSPAASEWKPAEWCPKPPSQPQTTAVGKRG